MVGGWREAPEDSVASAALARGVGLTNSNPNAGLVGGGGQNKAGRPRRGRRLSARLVGGPRLRLVGFRGAEWLCSGSPLSPSLVPPPDAAFHKRQGVITLISCRWKSEDKWRQVWRDTWREEKQGFEGQEGEMTSTATMMKC